MPPTTILAAAPRRLPSNPSIEHLKKEAKDLLRRLRESSPDARLADAQLQVARSYGFSSWRALAAEVGSARGNTLEHRALVGWFRLDPQLVRDSVIAITSEAGRLFAQDVGRPKIPLTPDGIGGFAVRGLDLRYSFEGAPDAPAAALVIERTGATMRATRVSEDQAEAAQAAFARALADQARPRSRIVLAPEALKRFVGSYLFPSDLAMEIRVEGAKLLAQAAGQQALEIQPEGPERFFWPMLPAQIVFEGEGDDVTALTLHQDGRIVRGRRVPREMAETVARRIEQRRAEQERPRSPIALPPEALTRFCGQYGLNAGAGMVVAMEHGRLFGQVTGQRRFELFAETETGFFLTMVAAQVSFVADQDGRPTHAVLHQNGRDLLMVRIEDQEEDR